MIYSLWKYFEPYANLKYSFPNGSVVKNLPEMQETCRRCGFDPWVRKILCRKKWQPAPVLLPGKSNGQRSLADDSPWDHKESDTTERLNNKFAKLLFSRSSHVRLSCDPVDCSRPGSSVHWISQARILEWVAISSSRGFSWPRDRTHVFCVSCIVRWILYHWATWGW